VNILRWCLVLLSMLAGLAGPASASSWAPGASPTGKVLVDPTGQLGPDDALRRLRAGLAQAYSETTIYPTNSVGALWFLLDVPQDTVLPSVLQIPYPGLDSLRLYLPDSTGANWQILASGDELPVSSWAIPHLFPAMPVQGEGVAGRQLLLRAQNSHPVTYPWRIEERMAFEARHQRLVLLLGMYLGLVALVVVLSATNAYTLREPVHAVYAVHVLALSLTQSTLTGVSGLFLWPDSPRFNDTAATVLPMVSLAALAWFVRTVVSPPPRRWLGWLLWVYAGVGLVFAGLFATIGRDPVFRLANYYFLAGIPLLLGTLIWHARVRSVHGWWLVAGLSALFGGAVFTALRNLNVVPMNTVTQYGAQLGAALEIPLLMIGLYLRSRDRRDALVRRSALQTRDPVTGLANDRVIRERVDHLVHRLALQPGKACVMRVRVGNLRDIFNDHGIQVMAGATLHAAACLALITHEGDTAGRLKDGDFVLILERPFTEEQAMQEAARVVARGLAYSKRLPPGVSIRFHVGISLSGHAAGDSTRLLDGLAVLLDEIARAPQRVIRVAPALSAPASRAGRLAKG